MPFKLIRSTEIRFLGIFRIRIIALLLRGIAARTHTNTRPKPPPNKHLPYTHTLHLASDISFLLLDALHQSERLPLGPLLQFGRKLRNSKAKGFLVHASKLLRGHKTPPPPPKNKIKNIYQSKTFRRNISIYVEDRGATAAGNRGIYYNIIHKARRSCREYSTHSATGTVSRV